MMKTAKLVNINIFNVNHSNWLNNHNVFAVDNVSGQTSIDAYFPVFT